MIGVTKVKYLKTAAGLNSTDLKKAVEISLKSIQQWHPIAKDLQDLCDFSEREYQKRRLTGSLGSWSKIN